MRALLLSCFLLGCGGQTTVANEGTADGTAAPQASAPALTAEAHASSEPASTAPPATTSAATSAPAADKSSDLTVEKGSAKGVEVKNDAGKTIKVGALAWVSSRRTNKGLGSKEVPSANVSFGSVTADGATANEVVCELPPWDMGEGASVAQTTAMIALVAQDSMPTASLLKAKAQIAKCSNGKPVRLKWSVQGGTLSSVDAGDPKVSACLTTSLKPVAAFGTGTCVATFQP